MHTRQIVVLQASNKLPLHVKLGYAIGQMADSLAYNLFYVFYLFFLTNVANIPAGQAGTIILIAVIWDAVADPLVGQFSDTISSHRGRRRPLMLAAILPYTLLMLLLYTDISTFSVNQKTVYFTIIAILFWSAYKIYVIPFYTLGAEMTNDFDERTSLRVWAGYALNLAVLVSSSAPPLIVKGMVNAGCSVSTSWFGVSLIFAILTLISGLACWYLTQGYELPARERQSNTDSTYHPLAFIGEVFNNMFEIARLSSSKFLGASVFFWSAAYALSTGALYYLFLNNMAYSEQDAAISFLIFSLLALAWLPIVNYTAQKFDKKNVYYLSMLISSIGTGLFYFCGFPNRNMLLIYLILLQLGNSYFWTVYYSMMYDICELDDFINSKRREGAITALMSFLQKFGSALSIWFIGLYIDKHGYISSSGQQAMTQPPQALHAILELNTWIHALAGLLAALFAIGYPLTRSRYQALLTALQAKKEQQSYTTSDFKQLL
ncbi:MFS transporter [Snodgrassella gandavensis]|uniref:MFS transporter n=1 Tax=Snodgrassella gandavensis TaxID=2946698 RepID=UPI001EF5367B|nr:MFS transporter [Snodgrassella gandavensis]